MTELCLLHSVPSQIVNPIHHVCLNLNYKKKTLVFRLPICFVK